MNLISKRSEDEPLKYSVKMSERVEKVFHSELNVKNSDILKDNGY